MKVKKAPSTPVGQWFQPFELELSSYPTEVPCCCSTEDCELMYCGNKQFRVISIQRNYSMNRILQPSSLKRGTLIVQNDCGKDLDKDQKKA